MFSFGRFTEPNPDCGPLSGVDYVPCVWAPPVPLWHLSDLPMYFAIALVGGLAGALWNQIQTYITLVRMR